MMRTLSFAIVAVLLPAAALATDRVFDGGTNGTAGNWNLSSNWNPDGIPGSSDNVVGINLNQTPKPASFTTFMTANLTVNDFTLDGSSETEWIIRNFSNASAKLTVGGDLTAATNSPGLQFVNNSTGAMNLAVAGSLASGFGESRFGYGATPLQSLTVSGTTTLSSGVLSVNSPNATLGDLVVSGGALNIYQAPAGGGTGGVTAASLSGAGGTLQVGTAYDAVATGTLTLAGNEGTHTFGGTLRNSPVSSWNWVLALDKTGDNTQIFSSSSTLSYEGTTSVQAGGLIIHGNASAATGDITVASAARFGGNGTIGGDLELASGGRLIFDETWTLTVSGSKQVGFLGDFGVDDLIRADGTAIDWESVALDSYTLILGDVDTTNLANLGYENRLTGLAGGREAYFETASLTLVVVPEPSTGGLLVGSALFALAVWRRSRMSDWHAWPRQTVQRQASAGCRIVVLRRMILPGRAVRSP